MCSTYGRIGLPNIWEKGFAFFVQEYPPKPFATSLPKLVLAWCALYTCCYYCCTCCANKVVIEKAEVDQAVQGVGLE